MVLWILRGRAEPSPVPGTQQADGEWVTLLLLLPLLPLLLLLLRFCSHLKEKDFAVRHS